MTTPSSQDPGRIFPRKPTPRALILTRKDEFAESVAELFPVAERVERVTQRRQAEFDVVVATSSVTFDVQGAQYWPAAHLFMVLFGVSPGEVLMNEANPYGFKSCGVRWTLRASLAREFERQDVPPVFEELVETDLIPTVGARTEAHNLLTTDIATLPINHVSGIPLLKTADGGVLASLFERPDGGLVLALPGDVAKGVEWVKAALKAFRAIEPDRFQQIPGWEERWEWSTSRERELRTQLGSLRDERRRLTEELDTREASIRTALAQASSEAQGGLRRILTASDDDLVAVVKDALETCGFAVVLVDEDADPNNKLEDLRVTDPTDTVWEALVEVRSYKGGAQLSDLGRVERFVRRYRDETDRWPPAVWYIVNQRRGLDPDVRQPVLSSQQRELDEWSEANAGLAIDTSDLFRLTVAVEAGEISPADARGQLRDATTRFTFEPEGDAERQSPPGSPAD